MASLRKIEKGLKRGADALDLKALRPELRISMAIYLAGLLWFCFSLPEPLFREPTSFLVEGSKGELLAARVAGDGQWRFPPGPELPSKFRECILAFEDKRFYLHRGLDPLALGRAAWQNLRSGRIVSGGSTLSMQVIRLSRKKPRTLKQKLLEIVLAFRLELRYSKDEILALYAGNAPFGGNVVGLEAASWRYFGRSPADLSWGEMSALAVLPNSPSLVYPGKNQEMLRRKRARLLERLAASGAIDSAGARLAALEPLPRRPLALPRIAPHLLTRFYKDYIAGRGGEDTRARSSIDVSLQEKVNALLNDHHQELKANGIQNAAALVLRVSTGETLVYAGNVLGTDDPEAESEVDMIPALRSPGSTLKPVLYAAMLSDGLLLPHTLVPDVPTQIAGFTPQNFDLEYNGAVPASQALSRSLNIPAVKMLQDYRYERFHALLRKLGLGSLSRPAGHYGLSLILGGAEVSMWELAGLYAGMARTLNHQYDYDGRYDPGDFRPPVYLASPGHNEGQPGAGLQAEGIHQQKRLQRQGLLDAAAIWFSFQAMEEVLRPGEESLWQQFSSSRKIAWKTGTSFGFRDAWAIGLSPEYVVAVWAGNADGEGRPGLTGIRAAAPLLFDIFRLLPASPPFMIPYDKMARVPVCRESGHRASALCTLTDSAYIPRAGLRSNVCAYHQWVHLDPSGQWRVSEACEAPSGMIHKSWFVLPPAMEWYYRSRNPAYRPLPPFRQDCLAAAEGESSMAFIYPAPGARIYIPLEIDGKRGEAVFSAAHHRPSARIYWHLDGAYLGSTTDFHQLALSPEPGRHTLTLVDDRGERLSGRFEILDKQGR